MLSASTNPEVMPVRPRPPSRRAVLTGGAAAAALTACGTAGHPPPVTPPAEDPDRVLLRELIAEKERTVALYTALISSGAAKLVPFRDRHQAHLAELRRRSPDAGKLPTTASTATTSPPPKVSLTRLRDVERRAAALRPRQIADVSPPLAQLVASIGACEAAHAAALPRSL
ncbi:twin-arginine translocation signal domain-containing protein [Nonomuraea sediminis]|uniref:twin-arginine translocation signal domain-containing protein n=1 Tax=Nonomuraea sediminis TaxID=2835864 RepID=UPI002029BE58|nr:twin-arginine translocation signal domain-containing protein [Nonomuraea sediminis]